ncbi:putative pentatricopeptide repeat-containing protein [Panicum miliaceum]|uniref:Pentatricopeptide repeat-containing protein n=1 Tax=Panicum miliaceum TaxID=4540 RepID=A0A3L6Q3N1_PANMI|nr:putative pentatricopeptide repeat-containing protein [Panicum miliaceum]
MESHETSVESHGPTATQSHGKGERFLDFLRAAPSNKLWFHRFGSATLRARTVDWRALGARCKA